MSAAATTVSLADYLRMSFDGPDAEYVDGEIVERPMPKYPHAEVQQSLAETFGPLRRTKGIGAGPEIRVQISPRVIRVPDYCVFRSRPEEDAPSTPALLVVEVISPSESYSALIRKLEDYLAWGAEHIWVIDPELKRLSVYRNRDLIHVEQLELSELGVTLTLEDLFDEPR